MSVLDKQVKQILNKLTYFLSPKGMTAKERALLAKAAGISIETLRTSLKRKTMNADTLLRLLMARGISVDTLENLHQTETDQLPSGEVEWLEMGRELTDIEKREMVGLIRFLKVRWQLKAK